MVQQRPDGRSFSSLLKTLMHRKQRLDSRRWINSLNEMQDQRPDGRRINHLVGQLCEDFFSLEAVVVCAAATSGWS